MGTSTRARARAEPATVPRVILVFDLAGFARAFESRGDPEMAAFLEDYYELTCGAIEGAGGRVVKLIGDAVLAVFPPEEAAAALAVATALEQEVTRLAGERGVSVELGADLHHGLVLEGEMGWGRHRRLDVIGRVVNETFLLGRGAGLRISEEIVRRIPADERSSWRAEGGAPRVYRRLPG